ncbi:GtrA family protein [Corynebacterium aquatimens]|uniref:GtrA family protein n=1 Tax=Corynebacterium aquatimens TaxID=1190508 RepID=UPI0036114D1F
MRILPQLREFIKFGVVGGSGVIVNLATVYVVTKLLDASGITADDVFTSLAGTRFNIRWYHVIMTIAFVVANTWNYQLNRSWTFRKLPQRSWISGYFPFLATGILAFLVSLTVSTLLMNPTSLLALPPEIFDDSSGLRTRVYWAAAISTLVAMPVNFVINKIWTFGRPKVVMVDEHP